MTSFTSSFCWVQSEVFLSQSVKDRLINQQGCWNPYSDWSFHLSVCSLLPDHALNIHVQFCPAVCPLIGLDSKSRADSLNCYYCYHSEIEGAITVKHSESCHDPLKEPHSVSVCFQCVAMQIFYTIKIWLWVASWWHNSVPNLLHTYSHDDIESMRHSPSWSSCQA